SRVDGCVNRVIVPSIDVTMMVLESVSGSETTKARRLASGAHFGCESDGMVHRLSSVSCEDCWPASAGASASIVPSAARSTRTARRRVRAISSLPVWCRVRSGTGQMFVRDHVTVADLAQDNGDASELRLTAAAFGAPCQAGDNRFSRSVHDDVVVPIDAEAI